MLRQRLDQTVAVFEPQRHPLLELVHLLAMLRRSPHLVREILPQVQVVRVQLQLHPVHLLILALHMQTRVGLGRVHFASVLVTDWGDALHGGTAHIRH